MNEENRAAEQKTEKRLSPEEAARAGDLATLRYWIEERGFDVNAKKGYYGAHRSILVDAIEGQDLATVRYLVEEAGAQVEYGREYVPLVRAALDGAWEIVRYLVEERRVRVEETDDHWGTILHVAARTGDLALTKSVVEKYDAAKLIKYETFIGETPIFYAVESGALDVVRYLVELGSDVNLELDLHYPESCSSDHKRLTHVAAENGFLDILRYLIEEAGADPGPYWGYDKGTPTSLALENRHWETARYLLNEVGLPVERWEINGAARGGDLTVFKECLAKRPDYLADWENDEYKRSCIVEALSAAIKVDALDIVRYLIEERGVDVGIKGEYDETPILCAARANKPDILRYLVERGADVNVAKSFGETALQFATSANALEIVRFLVKSGADVNAKDKDGKTALHYATGADCRCELNDAPEEDALSIVRFLVESGADVNAANDDNQTPLAFAAWRDALSIVRFLLESGANVDGGGDGSTTPLHEAAELDAWGMTCLLLEAGANVNAANSFGETALHKASARGSLEIVRYLLESGADVDARDKDGETALYFASARGGLGNIRCLCEAGASVDVVGESGKTPLHLVVERVSAEFVRYLVELGADVNAPIAGEPAKSGTIYFSGFPEYGEPGETALHIAAKKGEAEIVRILLEAGADLEAKNGDGETALQLAFTRDCSAVLRVLVEFGADVASLDKKNFKAWHIAARFGKTGALRFLFELGADVDAKDEKGKTALHLAAERDNSGTVLTLLELGADFTAKDADGKTPRECVKDGLWSLTKFFLVAANGDEPKALRGQALIGVIKRYFIYRDEWANMLLEKGNVDLNATDRDGDTALHAAAKSFHDSGESWIKWLLEAGADPTRLNRKGETPLEVARRREHRDALEAPTRERLRAKRLARAERKRKEKR